MDSDIVDDVNALLKLGVGDAYRLEHIKQAYIENKTVWGSDGNYLQQMREKYLVDLHTESEKDTLENLDDKNAIHCWKCGKKNPMGANFCMTCGHSLFEVGTESQPIPEKTVETPKKTKTISLKIPIIIGVSVLILAIVGVAVSQGYTGNVFEKNVSSNASIVPAEPAEKITSGETNSKCGTGTVFDPKTNMCVLS